MTRTRLSISALFLLCISSMSVSQNIELMNARLRKVAGTAAIDCGTVFYPQETPVAGRKVIDSGTVSYPQKKAAAEPRKEFQCALQAFSERKPFYVQFVPSQNGIDSTSSEGFAGNKKGSVYQLHYTQEHSSTGNNPPREYVTSKKCSAPLRITPGGMLSCIPAP